MLGHPHGAGEIKPAQIGALQQGRSSLHVVIGHGQRNVELVVVADLGQRINGDVRAVGCRLVGRVLHGSGLARRALACHALGTQAGSRNAHTHHAGDKKN